MRFGKLEVIAFIAGFGVMIIELAGERELAPYFGDTLYTWTSAISVVLASLSVGYYFSGWLADKKAEFRYLAIFLLIGGISVSLLPIISGGIMKATLGMGYEYGPLLASILVFSIPNFLLGMISPYAIRLRAKSIENVGKSAGDIYATATVGSIVGALLTGYILIPYVGLNQSFFGLSAVLIVAGVIVLGRRAAPLLAVAALVVAAPLLYVSAPVPPVIYQAETPYQYIQVLKSNGIIALRGDTVLQSIAYASNDTCAQPYCVYPNIIAANWPGGLKSVLIIGLGSGADAMDMYRYTNASITGVEIDPDVVQVAYKYFNLPHSNRVKVVVEDGRYFLRTNTSRYDMIIMDAFGSAIATPYQLTTVQAVQEMKNHLVQNGSVIVTVLSPFEGNGSAAFKAIYNTYKAVFPHIYVFATEPQNLTAYQIIVLVASNVSAINIPSNLVADYYNATGQQKEFLAAESAIQTNINSSGYPVLTDNLNPYDTYAAEAVLGT